MKKTRANSMANTAKVAAFPAAKARWPNMRTGTMGWLVRSSQSTKATVSSAPPASAAATCGLDQPMLLARIRAQTRPSAPPVARIRPGRSSGVRDPAAAGILVRISGIMTAPIGTLSQKIQVQSRPWVTAPPTTGPARTAIPVTLLKMPRAQARRCGG